MNSSRRLVRLLAIAAGGSGCASERPPATEPTSTVPLNSVATTASRPVASAAPAGSGSGWAAGPGGSAAASAAPAETGRGVPGTLNVTPVDPEVPDEPEDRGGRGAPAAGATALCRDGLAGVPGSWCSHIIPGVPRGFFGKPHESCRATPAGKFACPAVTPFQILKAQVCVPKTGACAAKDSREARTRLDARYQTDGCPSFMPGEEATVVRDGAGKDQCCYTGDFALCVGRPMWVAGMMRVAARRVGLWG